MKKTICDEKNRRDNRKLTLKRADVTASLKKDFEGNPVQQKTVKRKLAQSKIELQAFFNQAPDLFCIIQPDGTLGQLNTAWKSLLGWTPTALRSQPWIELVHPDDVESSQRVLQQVREGQTCYINNRCYHKDGSYRSLSWSLCKSKDGYWYAVAREVIAHPQVETTLLERSVTNITNVHDELHSHKQAELALQERTKALQEANQRLMLHIENSPLAVLEWDREFRLLYWSKQAEKIFGWKAEEVIGKHLGDWPFVDDQNVEPFNLVMSKLLNGSELRNVVQNRNLTKEGSVVDCEWYNSVLFDESGNLLSIQSRIQDVTRRKQAESSLQLTQARLQYLLSHNPAVLYSCNVEGNYGTTFMSENVAAVLGYQAQEFLADDQFWKSRIHPEDAPHILANLPQLFEQGHHVQEYRFLHQDGSYRWIHNELKLVRDEDGKPREMVGYWTDITDTKQAELAIRKNAEMLSLLLEYTPTAIAMFDKDMKYQLVSRRYLKDYNLVEQDIIGKSHYEILPEMAERWKEMHQRCLQGTVEQCEEELFIRADGIQDWVKWEIRPWVSTTGEISGIILSSEVITEPRKAKEKLQRLNEKLLHSNRDLEQFAYVASHDLQEPLRAVNSYTQLLARKYQDKLDAKAHKYISYIVEGANRMQQLINDLLEFSRVGRHGTDLAATDCETVLSQVLANLKVAIAQTHAAVTHDSLPIVIGDETQLTQLLQNLICNSIKFRREEPPQVHLTATHSENEWVFSLHDNGIGMEREYFDRIFTIFQRLHSRRDYPGTGIGLAVCKKIVERHGGRIWVESELGVGTTFHFTIPQTRP